ncbi:MAG: glycosyltransferase family 4 protein [Candidatus Omnitrophica bacterium]|nr:glycosyltransferase family 4 protein [Candidatus Omnitrophota bacterium]
MNVLALCREYPPYNNGGMGYPLYYLVKYGVEKDIKFTLITNYPSLRIFKVKKKDITQIFVPTLGENFLTKIPSYAFFSSLLVKKLQEKCDIIYSTSSPFIGSTFRPLIFHIQGTRYGEALAARKIGWTLAEILNKSFIGFDKMMVRKGVALIFPSQALVTEVSSFSDIKQKQYAVIPNGVDTTMFYPRGKKSFISSFKRILYVGRLDRRKGVDRFFYVLDRMKSRLKFKFIIVGSGREYPRLLYLAEKLGLPVEFKGKVDHQKLPEIYNAVDLFVMPSIYEPFGLVALEAMASGTPTVVSVNCPLDKIPKFDPYDVENTAEMLLGLLSSPDKLRRLSERCREVALEYDWQVIVDKMVNFMERFLK